MQEVRRDLTQLDGPFHDAAGRRSRIPTVIYFVPSLQGFSHTKLEDAEPRSTSSSPSKPLDRLASKTVSKLSDGSTARLPPSARGRRRHEERAPHEARPSRAGTMHPGAVPAQDVLGLQLPEDARQAEPKRRIDADRLAGRDGVPGGPEGVGNDEDAPLGLPEGDLPPEPVPDDADEPASASNRRAPYEGAASVLAAMETESRSCRSRSSTTTSGSPSARMRSSIPGASTGSKTAPRHRPRARGTCGRETSDCQRTRLRARRGPRRSPADERLVQRNTSRLMMIPAIAHAATLVARVFTRAPIGVAPAREDDERHERERDAEREDDLAEHQRAARIDAERRG